MPEISRFFGILIAMYYNDHPPPHFHAKYGSAEAIIAIETGEVMAGRLPQGRSALWKNGGSFTRQSFSRIGAWPRSESRLPALHRWSESDGS